MKSSQKTEHTQIAFEVYCKTLLRNKARDIYRRIKRQEQREVLFSDVEPALLDAVACRDSYCLSDPFVLEISGHTIQLDNQALADALANLLPKYREIIILSYFMQRSDPEIARELNVPVSTVNDRRKGALQRLRDRMNKDEQ